MLDKINSLIYALPIDIQLAKHNGDLEKENRLIDYYLNDSKTPLFLKDRLIVEREIIKRQYLNYPYTIQQGLELVQKQIPDYTLHDLQQAMDSGQADWIYINGEVRLQDRFFASMKKTYPDIALRSGEPLKDNQYLNSFIKEVKEKGSLKYHIHLRTSIKIKDEYFKPGKVLVHLPIPTLSHNVDNINIIASSDNSYIDSDSSVSRTISFKEDMQQNHEFFVEYEYDCNTIYHNILGSKSELCDINEYLDELYPHIVFTPTIKALCNELSKGLDNDIDKAYAFYKYACENVTYAFMPAYFTIENITEFAALHRIGDCGVKALLFITLCRCAGIPAHWQSGLYIGDHNVSNHDWAMFYIKPFGWLYADPSFGGSAYMIGNKEREDYYFGNLDCYRMVANNEYQQEFNPAKTCWRNDPYDNQSGEVEYIDDKGLISCQFDHDMQLISITKVE